MRRPVRTGRCRGVYVGRVEEFGHFSLPERAVLRI